MENELKSTNRLIGIRDLLIGATALSRGAKLATLNTKHFGRINDLEIIADI